MKKSRLSICFYLTFIVLFFTILNTKQDKLKNDSVNNRLHFSRNTHSPTSPGTKNDPYARVNREYFRLRNPETGKIPSGIARKQLDFAQTIPKVESIRMERLARGERVNNYGWKHRGPFNVAGRTRSLAIDIRNENIILSGGASGGIWKSTDNGQSWHKKSLPHQIQSFSYIIQDTRPGKEDTWYCATGEVSGGDDMARDFLPYNGDGIFKSTDNGETWTILPSTSAGNPQSYSDFNRVFKLDIDKSNIDDDEIYAAAYGSVFRSTDGGNSWDRVLYGSGWWSDVAVTSNGVAYAAISYGLDKGLWRSEDGITWAEITHVNWPDYFRRVCIAIAPSDEKDVYFLSDISDPNNISWYLGEIVTEQILWKYTYRSGDGSDSGGTWSNRSANLPHAFKSGYSYVLTVSVYPEDENIVFLGARRYYRSLNGFADPYQTVQIGGDYGLHPNSHADIHQYIYSINNPKIVYVANDGGISKTNDILEKNPVWERLDKGLSTVQFYSVAIAPDIPNDPRILAGAHDHGTFYLGDPDNEGKGYLIGLGDGGYNAIIDGGTKYLYSPFDENMFLTDKIPGDLYEGVIYYGSWPLDHFTTRVNPAVSQPLLFNPFIVDPNDDRIVYMAGEEDLLRCNNITSIPLDRSQNPKSQYWSVISSANSYVTAIGISKEPSNVLFYGTRTGEIYKLNNALGSNPQQIDVYTNKGLPRNSYVSNIDVDPHDADHVIVTFCNYEIRSIFSSWDGGQTWTDVSGNLEQYPTGRGSGPAVYWVEMLFENGGITYFAGTTTGLYSTTNLDGLNTVWAQEGAETIGNVNVKMIATREVDGEVVIASYGTGIYSRDFTTAVEENDHV
ncbi:MAG: hypothetical protein GY863_15450, partial [bacterium]|nr:hypothetical protein [bacterium]